MHPNEECHKAIRSGNGVHILPLLWCFHVQNETFSPSYYASKHKKRQGFRTRRKISDTFLTQSPTPSAFESKQTLHIHQSPDFLSFKSANITKISSHPSTVIECSISSRDAWARLPYHNDTIARSDTKSLHVLFASTFWWLFDDSGWARWFFVMFAQFWGRGNLATDGYWCDCASSIGCSLCFHIAWGGSMWVVGNVGTPSKLSVYLACTYNMPYSFSR